MIRWTFIENEQIFGRRVLWSTCFERPWFDVSKFRVEVVNVRYNKVEKLGTKKSVFLCLWWWIECPNKFSGFLQWFTFSEFYLRLCIVYKLSTINDRNIVMLQTVCDSRVNFERFTTCLFFTPKVSLVSYRLKVSLVLFKFGLMFL